MKKGPKAPDSGAKSKTSDKEDIALWRKVTESVRAYNPKTAPDAKPKTPKAEKAPAKKPSSPSMTRAKDALPAPPVRKIKPNPGFDRATETKFKRGQLDIDGRIDLHGMTQEEAFAALSRFVARAVKAEWRTLIVITGKGERSQGVLKRMLPLWLEDERIAPHVLALSPAQPKDGGGGAFYLRLRKKR